MEKPGAQDHVDQNQDNVDRNQNNVYQNSVVGATANPLMPDPDEIDERFAQAANEVLEKTLALSRALVGAHQGAAAIIVEGDWGSLRKFFSLSKKYEAWKHYDTPAKGYGTHAWLLEHNRPVRFTQAELEAHPAWQHFGRESEHHPPMRGWLAAPLVDSKGKNWGLLQLSDKYEGEFSAEDEAHFVELAELTSLSLEALWALRNERKR